MKKALIILTVAFTAQFGFSQKTTFKQDLMKFFEVSGGSTGMESLQDQFLLMVDEADHENFKKEFAVLMDDYYTKITEVFQEEFSQEDIKSLIAVTEEAIADGNENIVIYSDIGKKFLEKESILEEKLESKLMTWGLDFEFMMSKFADMSEYMDLEVEAVEVESGSYGGSGQGTGSGTGRR